MSIQKIKKQIAVMGKGYGKLGFNYYCDKCNEYFRWKKLKGNIQEGIVPAKYMCCPNCDEMIVDVKKRKK